MSYTAKIVIPKINSDRDVKLYIYRSLNADDINTISKVSELQPVIIVDQSIAVTRKINGKDSYMIIDDPNENNDPGITYLGPTINTVPIHEYETTVNIININNNTFVNELILSPLELEHREGLVYYYSVIGVIEDDNRMTHLSKVSGVLINYIGKEELKRQVWSCNDYNDSDDDEWELVNTLEYNEAEENIKIGNITRPYNISSLGLPMVEKVPKIPEENINVSVNSLISDTYMILEIENPWKGNNERYNYRRLKSYKIRNIYENNIGEFSVPTYQSLLPVPIEKMVILMQENPEDENNMLNVNDTEHEKFEVIRREGIFYNRKDHKSLSYNRWSIPLEENKLSVFSETSVQENINIQISGNTGNTYVFDIYLIDVYQNVSEPSHYVINT